MSDRPESRFTIRTALLAVACFAVLLAPSSAAERTFPESGLAVRIGAESLDLNDIGEELAEGRFLAQVLDTSEQVVADARSRLQAAGLYGLVSVDLLAPEDELPYAENMVNILVVSDQTKLTVSESELFRVLRPNGMVLVSATESSQAAMETAGFEIAHAGADLLIAKKPWPAEMDEWGHSRHAADGNAVSADMLAGPPRRIRWVAGPSRESSRMVTAGGRNFYADVLARDSFNGLRLWDRTVKSGRAVPIASDDRVFAVVEGKLSALDGATGETLLVFEDAGTPIDIMKVDDTLLAVTTTGLKAWSTTSGEAIWSQAVAEPQYVIAGDDSIYLLEGSVRRGEKLAVARRDLATGEVVWSSADPDYLDKVRRSVYHNGRLVLEVSTLNDDKPGNGIHVFNAEDGKPLFSREFVPSMNHTKQARAMFVGDLLWIVEHIKCVALDPTTGEVVRTHDAGHCHCFPPVATPRFMLAGEMEFTDLITGVVDANRITKAACGRDAGWVPANGLVNVFPKHCVCWPMLRGYAALAPALPDNPANKPLDEIEFPVFRGVDAPTGVQNDPADWTAYRQDAWRSGSTAAEVPTELETLWTVELGTQPEGPIADDWRENPFVSGPVTPPVIAGGIVYVARPDAHELVALNADSGDVAWRFTANGRIDTAPTLHKGLCLFGTKAGWVYCLRADDGQLVWRLRAAPSEQRIIAYGQLESPWPVPGSILVIDDTAYFAAGRQPLADGGILLFAVNPTDGAVQWVQRLDELPYKEEYHSYYTSNSVENDNFNLLHREGDGVAMSRWVFDRADGQITVKAAEAFVHLTTGGSGVIAPRGCWTYAPRHQTRTGALHSDQRPLAVFRENTLLGCSEDKRTIYRRDFTEETVAAFDNKWITGWAYGSNSRDDSKIAFRAERLAQGATWSVPVADEGSKAQISAMVLTAGRLFAADNEGRLTVFSTEDGSVLARQELPTPVWDGMAAVPGRLVVSTQDGRVVCLGEKK